MKKAISVAKVQRSGQGQGQFRLAHGTPGPHTDLHTHKSKMQPTENDVLARDGGKKRRCNHDALLLRGLKWMAEGQN